MGVIEAVGEALKLFFLTVQYVLDESKKHAQDVLNAQQKRAIFDASVAKAQGDLRGEQADEDLEVDKTDDAVDRDALVPIGTTPAGGVVSEKKSPVDNLGNVVDLASAKPRPDVQK